MGLLWCLTATSADDGCGGRVVRGVGRAEDAAEGVDGLALEAESDVGVDAGGDADVSVAEKFLDHDEIDALFQEQSGGRVPEIAGRGPEATIRPGRRSSPARDHRRRIRSGREAAVGPRAPELVRHRQLDRAKRAARPERRRSCLLSDGPGQLRPGLDERPDPDPARHDPVRTGEDAGRQRRGLPPPYVQAADELRRQINSGELEPGEKLPTSRELQQTFGIVSATAQNALRHIRHPAHPGRADALDRRTLRPDRPPALRADRPSHTPRRARRVAVKSPCADTPPAAAPPCAPRS